MYKIEVRDVGAKHIYDSYKGILRISPSELNGELVDSMTLAFTNPWVDANTQRKIILSDSDGIRVGIYFTAFVKKLNIVDANKNAVQGNIINVSTNVDENLFVTNSFNIRSTLSVNREGQIDRVSPIQIYRESIYYKDTFDVLAYPVDSPHDDSYFNAGNKLNLIDYNDRRHIKEQLDEALYNKDRTWYDQNIGGEHRVKILGKYIYTQNYKFEEVPILYTKEYVFGHYNGHTARLSEEAKAAYLGPSVGQEKAANVHSTITKTSYLPLDEIMWKVLEETLQGYVRDSTGHFTQLGPTQDQSICERLFGTTHPPMETSPMMGLNIPSGLIMYTAMPFRRWLFHSTRQQLRNAIEANNDLAHLPAKIKEAYQAGKITPINKTDPGFINVLTKEFVLCNGGDLSYDYYPYMSENNGQVYQHDSAGNVVRGSDKKPLSVTNYTGIYEAIKNSSPYKKVTSPSMLVTEQRSPRYLRGANWITDMGVSTPIDFHQQGIESGAYQDNKHKFEVVPGSDYGLTEKDHSDPGPHRATSDWKTNVVRHRHHCFVSTEDANRTNVAGNMIDESIIYKTIGNMYVTQHTIPPGECEDLHDSEEPDGYLKDEDTGQCAPVTRSWWMQHPDSGKHPGECADDTCQAGLSTAPTDDTGGSDDEAGGQGNVDYEVHVSGPYYEPEDEDAEFGFTIITKSDCQACNPTAPKKGLYYYSGRGWGKSSGGHTDIYEALTTPSIWTSRKGVDQRMAKPLADYSFLKPINNVPNSWQNHMPIPSAGLWAWKLDSKGNVPTTKVGDNYVVSFCSSELNAGKYVIQNDQFTQISSDPNQLKKQLEAMNYAEGTFPVAMWGGCEKSLICHQGNCKNRHVSHGQLHYYHGAFENRGLTGGYKLQNASGVEGDVPRCVTSLPIVNIWEKAKGADTVYEAEMGDQHVELDDSLSYPPSMVMLPLFKI